MKMQNIALDEIVPNPWRDMKLYPIDADHVRELRESIDDHGFFGGVKGRRRNGKVEVACGHMRIEAARKAKLDTVPIFIDELDDDEMLRLMTDENALQSGSHPGAVLNEVSAVTRRLIDGLLVGTVVPTNITKAFENEREVKAARTKLRDGKDIHLAVGHGTVRRYLGQGRADKSHRAERQVREAISALKQSGHYDDMIETALAKYPPPVSTKSSGKNVEIANRKPRRPRTLDERVANVFPNEHQFHAFRDAVTAHSAQKVLPVDKQLTLAKEIMGTINSQFSKKQVGAPYIRKMVQDKVQQGLKMQRDINKEEREQYLRDQREERINSEVSSANSNLRGLLSALAKIADLADEFPAHPKLRALADRLDTLVDAIKQFSKKLK